MMNAHFTVKLDTAFVEDMTGVLYDMFDNEPDYNVAVSEVIERSGHSCVELDQGSMELCTAVFLGTKGMADQDGDSWLWAHNLEWPIKEGGMGLSVDRDTGLLNLLDPAAEHVTSFYDRAVKGEIPQAYLDIKNPWEV